MFQGRTTNVLVRLAGCPVTFEWRGGRSCFKDAVWFSLPLSGSPLMGHGHVGRCVCSESMFSFLDETGGNKPLEGSGGKGMA